MSVNEFQRRATSALAEALTASRKPPLEFTLVRGRKEEFLVAKASRAGQSLDVYIYDDEAGFMSGGTKWKIFERPDYVDDVQLIRSFVAALLKVLD